MKVSKVIQETPSTKVFRLSPEKGKLFAYSAGQFIIMNIYEDESTLHRRSYSIASSPLQEYLELCIKINDAGTTGPTLKKIKEGDKFDIEGPHGRFTLDMNKGKGKGREGEKKIFFVGSGSGIAPLISMIRTIMRGKNSYEHYGFPEVHPTLIYGFRNEEDFTYRKELESYEKNLQLIPISSRPPSEWKYLKGHVQDAINCLPNTAFKDSEWYLCGPPAMVRQLKEILLSKKVSEDSIKTEMFD